MNEDNVEELAVEKRLLAACLDKIRTYGERNVLPRGGRFTRVWPSQVESDIDFRTGRMAGVSTCRSPKDRPEPDIASIIGRQ
jgi:hypothetical protein